MENVAISLMRGFVRLFGEDRTLLAISQAIPDVSDQKIRDLFEVAE